MVPRDPNTGSRPKGRERQSLIDLEHVRARLAARDLFESLQEVAELCSHAYRLRRKNLMLSMGQVSGEAALEIPSYALGAFHLVTLFVPKRLSSEEIGDALEEIEVMVQRQAAPWKIRMKVVSTVFWISINALREVTSALLGKAGSS